MDADVHGALGVMGAPRLGEGMTAKSAAINIERPIRRGGILATPAQHERHG